MDKELSLSAIFKLLREKMRWILLAILLFSLVTFVYSTMFVRPQYRSSAELLVSPKSGENSQLTLNQLQTNSQLIKTYQNIIYSDDILDLVNSKLSAKYSNQELRDKIRVVSSEDSQTFEIQVTDFSSKNAANIVNMVTKVFQGELNNYYSSNFEIKVISSAKPSSQQVSPIILKNIFFAVSLAVISSSLIIIVLELISPMAKENEIEDYFSWLNLGSLSLLSVSENNQLTKNFPPKPVIFKRKRTYKESNHELIEGTKAKLQTLIMQKQIKTFMISSPESLTGKSTFAVQLAQSFAKSGKQILLIDANLRDPSLHKFFPFSNDKGLSDYLNQTTDLSIKKLETLDLFLLFGGTAVTNSAELLSSEKFSNLLKKLENRFDLIIVDSTALNGLPDSEIVALKIKSLLMVVRENYTKFDDLLETSQFITDYNINVLGFVFNKTKVD